MENNGIENMPVRNDYANLFKVCFIQKVQNPKLTHQRNNFNHKTKYTFIEVIY
jgi:hypothetical protein